MNQETGEYTNNTNITNKIEVPRFASTLTSFSSPIARDTSSSIIVHQSNISAMPSSLLYTSVNQNQNQNQQQAAARLSGSSGIYHGGIFTEQPPPEFFQQRANNNKRSSLSSELSLPLYSFEKSPNCSKNNNNNNNSNNSYNTSLSNSQSVTPLAASSNSANNNVATNNNNQNNNTPNLYVSNLSVGVTNDLLTSWFRAYGPLVSACVMVDVQTGRSRGYGFVQFENETDSETALNELNGKAVRVPSSNNNNNNNINNNNKNDDNNEEPTTTITVRVQKSMHHKGIPAAPSRTVFLRNIPISYDVDALTAILSKFGQVERVQLFPIFENPKLLKASINFATTEGALAAVNALHRKLLDPGCDVALAARFGESSKKMTTEAAALATASHVAHASGHHHHHHHHLRQFASNIGENNNNSNFLSQINYNNNTNYPAGHQTLQPSQYAVPIQQHHQQQMTFTNNNNNNIPAPSVIQIQHQHHFIPQHHFVHHHHHIQHHQQHMMMSLPQNNHHNNNFQSTYQQPQTDMPMVLVQMFPGQPPVLVPASQIGFINNQNNNNNGMMMMMLPNFASQNQMNNTSNIVTGQQHSQQFM